MPRRIAALTLLISAAPAPDLDRAPVGLRDAEEGLDELRAPRAKEAGDAEDLARREVEGNVGVAAPQREALHGQHWLPDRVRETIRLFRELPAGHVEGEGLPIEVPRAAGGGVLPAPEDRVALGYLEDLVELVGDEEDRDPPGLEALDHGEEGFHLLLGQGGGGLVHDDELRVLQKGAADRNELAVRDREVLHALVEVDGEADEGDGVGSDGPCPAVVHQLAAVHELHVQGEVLHHGQVGEDGEILVDDLDAEGDGFHRGEPGEGTSADLDAARIGLVDAGDHLDEGGLARAVLAGEAMDLCRADLQAHPLERLHPSE